MCNIIPVDSEWYGHISEYLEHKSSLEISKECGKPYAEENY